MLRELIHMVVVDPDDRALFDSLSSGGKPAKYPPALRLKYSWGLVETTARITTAI